MEKRLDPEKAEEVIQEAVRLQQEHESGIPQTVLEASAQEMGVDPQHLREAIRRVEEAQARRARLRTQILVATGALVGLFLLNLLYSQSVLNRAWSEVRYYRAQVENVIQRRESLIPRLEALSQQVSAQQRAQLEALIRALKSNPEQAQALIVKLQSDPAFRNDWMFARLMDEIAGSENRIAVERKRYLEAVARYEQKARQFPINLARPILGYPKQVE